MNSIGAMSSPVKPSMPPVLAPPTISTSSPSKVQQPPNLTPLNLNTSQSAQPLSLVNEHKNVPIVITPPVMSSVENIVQKSSACNGIPDNKPIGEKIEEALPKIESQVPHNQVNSSINIKSANELPPLSDVKPQVSEVENLSQKKDDKNNLTNNQTDKVLSEGVETSIKEPPVKLEEPSKPENAVAKPKENDNTKVGQEPTEIQTVVQTNQGQTTPEKNEQSPNTSKVAVRRKREHKVSYDTNN